MKKLSELVNFKNQLDLMSTDALRDTNNQELDKITQLFSLENYNNLLDQRKIDIQKSFDAFELELEKLKDIVKQEISVLEKPEFQKSYILYEGEFGNSAEYILNLRKHKIPNPELFQARLSRYIDWQHSAMIIRPGIENFIDSMVALDPLYLVDLSHDYLAPALSKFNSQYQNRLRTYTVKEDLDQEILGQIPNDQFAVCFAYNYFNFRPFEILKKYLDEIYQKLTPGGVLVMTFNDCDRASAVQLVENFYCCYTPGYLIRELALSIGYEIEYSWNDPGPTTWLELKKPGTMTSLKGGQTLAKVLPK
jgi:SAM-dependent methyltransferase